MERRFPALQWLHACFATLGFLSAMYLVPLSIVSHVVWMWFAYTVAICVNAIVFNLLKPSTEPKTKVVVRELPAAPLSDEAIAASMEACEAATAGLVAPKAGQVLSIEEVRARRKKIDELMTQIHIKGPT